MVRWPLLSYIITTLFIILYFKYCIVFSFVVFRRMVIIVSVQYNGGFLPDIILLTQGYYHRTGNPLNAMKRFCTKICSL